MILAAADLTVPKGRLLVTWLVLPRGTALYLYLVGGAGSVAASNTIRPPTIVITGVMSLI